MMARPWKIFDIYIFVLVASDSIGGEASHVVVMSE